LLNGSGENSFISSAEGARGSDGFLSLPSPPQSRDSSADDLESYNTDDTIFEDLEVEPGTRGRKKSMDSKRSSGTTKDNGKGNVTVSVRVRPDTGGGDADSEDGEWMVDGRRSLISYRGREGGDHVYGMYRAGKAVKNTANSSRQRLFTT
jgi:centromeric protein E